MTTSKKAPDSEVIFFINGMYLSEEEQVKITLSDAIYTMCEWTAEGVEYPEGMTPEQFMYWWNQSIDEAERYPDCFEADDSDEI